MKLNLPTDQGMLESYRLTHQVCQEQSVRSDRVPFNRIAYAAAHLVIDPCRSGQPDNADVVVDWDASLAFRSYLYGLGFRVAEAMDTAQRGMGLPAGLAKQLIQRSLRHAAGIPGAMLVCGAATDQLAARTGTLDQIVSAYLEQFEWIESEGGRAVMMASRELCALAQGPKDYLYVYGRVLAEVDGPVILHWLGEVFDASLAGYWGSRVITEAMDVVLQIIASHSHKIAGIKVSLLDPQWELQLRARLPEGVAMYTGDDFNYPDLIAGDGHHFSNALLGIFDPIAPVAAVALSALASGDCATYQAKMNATLPLAREMFASPTAHYKAGVGFLAWLNDHQTHFTMAGGLQAKRSLQHYARLFRLADQAEVLIKPELALRRMRDFLRVCGGID